MKTQAECTMFVGDDRTQSYIIIRIKISANIRAYGEFKLVLSFERQFISEADRDC